MERVATKDSWKNLPIDSPKRIDISLHFSQEEFSRLQKGLIPVEMENKWFAYYEENWLYIYRSWTGYGMYKAQLIREGEKYCIKDFWVERNSEKYQSEKDEMDIDMFSFVIYRFILGNENYPLPDSWLKK